MGPFRAVILDYAKEQLDDPIAQKVFSDVLFVKQKNFLRTDPQYVVMDKHDMIGTHYLIYDTSNLHAPHLIFAIRTTYLSRSKEHGVETPLMSLLPRLESRFQQAFGKFQDRHPELVDCNSWFVDPAYSKKSSGLSLSDIGYFLVCMNVMRNGLDNIIGCTNETYHASRWVESVGEMDKGYIFEHPSVKAPHMMLMVENFNMEHFSKVYESNKELLVQAEEIFPANGPALPSFGDYIQQVFASSKRRAELKVA
ncbi:MAG: hypothetical protein AAGB31_11385 [Bdellovibrio sp.]